MQHGHPGFVGEAPEDLGRAADADLDRALGIEHAGEHGLAERPAMVEFGPVDLAHRVAMGVDMDETDRALAPQRLQDRIGDRMIAADRQRPHPGRRDAPVKNASMSSMQLSRLKRERIGTSPISAAWHSARGTTASAWL